MTPPLCGLLVGLCGLALLAGGCREDLGRRLAASAGGRSGRLSEDELARTRELFARTLALRPGERLGRLEEDWRELGFELARLSTGEEETLLALAEAPDRREGRGFYAFRPGAPRELVVQAPHALPSDDRHTSALALRLFLGSGAAAAGWSTVGRRQIDLARDPDTPFQAFTLAFAEAHPRGLVLQLHGFSPDRRTSAAGRRAEVILSNATAGSAPWTRELAGCLRAAGLTVAVYPEEVEELGASSNIQGQVLGRTGHAGFLHVEMSAALRARLVEEEDPGLLAGCLPERVP